MADNISIIEQGGTITSTRALEISAGLKVPVLAVGESYDSMIAHGHVTGTAQVNKYGRVEGVDTGDPPVDIWDGADIYTGFPTGGGETMEIFSSSTSDTGAGTGARTVIITNLLDDNKDQMPDIELTLDGTNPVSLGAGVYTRCTRLKVLTVGSAGHNVGNLTIRHSTTTANIFVHVLAEKNGTRQMTYTVPNGKTLYVQRGNIKLSRASGSAGSANVVVNVREDRADAPFVPVRDVEITNSDPYCFMGGGFLKFSAKIDMKVTVLDVSDNASNFSSEFDGYLVDDE